MQKFQSSKINSFNGTAKIPGDKSISHRSIMFGSLAIGTTNITGLLEGEDVMATAEAFRKMGATITKNDDGSWTVIGTGLGGLHQPDDIIDMGNSGTSTRLIMGIIAGHNIKVTMTGDASLRSRPMGRVIDPLTTMGAVVDSNEGKLPLTIQGTNEILPITYELPVASAQVKSAVLLAGLTSRGNTTVIETEPTRDHTENMLRHFGAEIKTEKTDGKDVITLQGMPTLKGADIVVPSDPSSASFIVASACIVKDSDVTVKGVCMNPTRTGLFTTLIEMGANITFANERIEGGEKIADINIKYAPLTGIDVPAERAPSMIDEYPILSVVASFANGKTTMQGVEELRVKESDRLQVVVDGLNANGVKTEAGEDWYTVYGNDTVAGGGVVKTHLDHRIAMSFLIMGLSSEQPVLIDDVNPVKTSFPTFVDLMGELGANFSDA
ncbi:MAG: 3-phosphoshikimate 1-carboxyvinyltransferase [Alphaproteobacteria bacterium]